MVTSSVIPVLVWSRCPLPDSAIWCAGLAQKHTNLIGLLQYTAKYGSSDCSVYLSNFVSIGVCQHEILNRRCCWKREPILDHRIASIPFERRQSCLIVWVGNNLLFLIWIVAPMPGGPKLLVLLKIKVLTKRGQPRFWAPANSSMVSHAQSVASHA